MDVLERNKIEKIKTYVSEEATKQARLYIKKRNPDIANQYITLAEYVQRSKTSSEAMKYQVILDSLNAINDLAD